MSAITGIFMRNGKDVDPDLMKKMNEKLSHRGPDGSAIWCDGPIGLGHQMLWTTQESLHEKLPFEENGLVITADARIDNREELSRELGLKDEEDVSDSYFILKSYDKWGEECPDKLLGDFAFAIWDKTEEKLFCARDHMGVKPFYYYLDDDMFVFGTEIKALLEILEVPQRVNEIKIADFLQLEMIGDKIFTFYEEIFRLIPAHYLSISHNENNINRYWELNRESQIIMNSNEEYVKAFREIFFESVKCRLRSVYPIGFDLSGGLDSSSIVCTAKKILDENKNSNSNLNTFSYVFDYFTEIDERHYINEIVKKGDIKSHFIISDNISPLEDLETILSHQDQPYSNPFLSIIRNSFKEMNNYGVRIALSGAGGDNVVYTGRQKYFLELARSLKWVDLIKEINFSSKITNQNVFKKIFKQIFIPLIPEKIKRNLKKLICPYTSIITCTSHFLNKNFENKMKSNKTLNKFSENNLNTVKEYHYFLINDLAQDFFEVLDGTSEHFSLDHRYPFYDKRMIEFCYSLPTEMKIRKWDRFILRLAMDNILPPKIQWRIGKSTYHSFLTKNLLFFEKGNLNWMIKNNKIIKDYVDIDKLKNIYEKYAQNEKVPYIEIYYLWCILVLSKWLKKEIYDF